MAILFATAAIDIVLYLFMPECSDVLPLRGHLTRRRRAWPSASILI